MVTKTGNLQLAQPAYNSTGWDVHFNGNMAIIDAALSQFFVQNNFLGIWENSTAYDVGDVVVDSTNSNIYTCAVGHTSPASPTTFATYRTANPSHWTNTSVVAAAGRGTWATATAYVKGDFVVSGTVYAVCTTNHTSGATFAGDSAYWSELIDVSAAVVSDGSIDGAKFADPLTIPGATTITAGGLTVTAGGLTITADGISVVAGATTLQGTTVQSGGLTVTAGGIGVTAGGINVAAGGLIVQAGGATITGNSTITGTLAGLTGLTVASGGLTVSTGGLTVAANGMTVTGNSTITGTLGGLTGLTVASGGATITTGGLTVTAGGITATGNSTITGTLGGLTGLTVASGGASITGNSTITGTLTGLTGLTLSSGILQLSSSGIRFNDTTTLTTAPTQYNPVATATTPYKVELPANSTANTMMLQTGRRAVTGSPENVTFATAFSAAPEVVASSNNGFVHVTSVSTTGCTLESFSDTGVSTSSTIHWMAFGPK